MSAEQNRALMFRAVEAMNAGDMVALSALAVPGCLTHGTGGAPDVDLATSIEDFAQFRTAFPDLKTEIEHIVANDEFVALVGRWHGTDPNSRRAFNVLGLGVDRVVDGKVVESWILLDTVAMQQQLDG